MTAGLLIAFVVGLVAGAGLSAWAMLIVALNRIVNIHHNPPAAPAARNQA